MKPRFIPIGRRTQETVDIVSFELPIESTAGTGQGFQPGQYNMLYAFGVGEIAVSISSDPVVSGRITHTIRGVGPVSRALTQMKSGEQVGVRGPFGSAWPVTTGKGRDMLIIAGGIGMAPLRPVIYHVLNNRDDYGEVVLLYGARHPDDLIFTDELDRWRQLDQLQVRVTVDHADKQWLGDVGLVTRLLPKVDFDPSDALAMICGPEVMIRHTSAALEQLGLEANRIHVSMERNMKCALGSCGHCQFGPHFVCKDGPVFTLDQIQPLLGIREI